MRHLTDLEVRRLIAEARRCGRRTDVRDEGSSGLELRAGPRGGVWRLKYVDGRSGRQERVILGYYPHVGLSEARRRADEERARIRDPRVLANPARELRDRAAVPTFRELAERRLAVGDLAPSTRDYYRWCIEAHANPSFGDVPAGEVRPEDVIAAVDRAARETPTTADRARAAVSSVFSWAVGERIVVSNPAMGLARRAANIPRDRTPPRRGPAAGAPGDRRAPLGRPKAHPPPPAAHRSEIERSEIGGTVGPPLARLRRLRRSGVGGAGRQAGEG